MKKLIFILFSLLLTVPSFAQEAEFKKAVSKNTKNEDGNYVADFSKQRFTEAEITSYAKSLGYEVIKFNYGKIKGYGMVLDGIRTVEFRIISTLAKDSDCQSFISDIMAKQTPDADGRYQAVVSTVDFNRVLNDWFTRSDGYFLLDSKKADGYRTSFTFVASQKDYDAIRTHGELHAIIDKYHPLNHSLDFDSIMKYYRSNPHSAEIVSDEDAAEIVDYFVFYDNFSSVKKTVEEALEILPKKVIRSEKFKKYLFDKVAKREWHPYDYSFTRVDFYNHYHEYPGWDSSKLAFEDNETYRSIEKEDQIRYYLGLFPKGLHASEVNGWYSDGSFSGWKQYRLDFIRKQAREAESYLRKTAATADKGQYGAYSEFKDKIKTSIKADCPADLRKALVFTEDLSPVVTDADSQRLFSRFKDYIVVINGFWAAKQSVTTSGSSLVAESFWGSIVSPGSPYALSDYAREIRECYADVVKTMEANTVIDSAVDGAIYQAFDKAEEVFVRKANNALASANTGYRADQESKSKYDHYEIKDGKTIIYLKNGDWYTFDRDGDSWTCKDGNGFHPLWVFVKFKGNSDQTALEQMVEFAERKNSEFYQ